MEKLQDIYREITIVQYAKKNIELYFILFKTNINVQKERSFVAKN